MYASSIGNENLDNLDELKLELMTNFIKRAFEPLGKSKDFNNKLTQKYISYFLIKI